MLHNDKPYTIVLKHVDVVDSVHYCVPFASQEVVKLVSPVVVNNGQALRLKAKQDLQDRDGV